MTSEYNVNIAEKYYGKLKAKGEECIADFVMDLAKRYKDLEHEAKWRNREISQLTLNSSDQKDVIAEQLGNIKKYKEQNQALANEVVELKAYTQRLYKAYLSGDHVQIIDTLKESRKVSLANHNAEVIAKHLHYPECWDTMAYPTLDDAANEAGCSVCAQQLRESKD